ncbi:hypothetical protein ABZ572_12255 [Streptomyces sp. NPDC018338]|uniref:hypothetical protein n=1 Tax=Streptomyces sp. NPDC018338 TaxID=3157192 RepID=UPI0033CF96FC
MRIGVLLLSVEDKPRQTTFTVAWARKAVAEVAAFFHAQSGGRVSPTFEVKDWQEAPFTAAEWHALGTGAAQAVADALGFSLASYDHVVAVIDEPASDWGTTPGTTTFIAAKRFSPSLLCHELGHRFKAADAWAEVNGVMTRYEDPWCVMGTLGHMYTVPGLAGAGTAGLDQAGPGMCVPNLLRTGWLDPEAGGAVHDLTDSSGVFQPGGVVVELTAQTGAPGALTPSGTLAVKVADVIVEYRVRRDGGADRGLPNPGRWVVAHRCPTGDPLPELADAFPAEVGTWKVLGEDNVFDIFHAGPLQILVMAVNEEAGTVKLAFSRRPARPPDQQVGVGTSDGVLVFIPGVGIKPIPPHSPLVGIVERVAAVHTLHQAQLLATEAELPALTERARTAVADLANSLTRVSPEPTPSPLEEARALIADVRHNGTPLDDTALASIESALAAAATRADVNR